MKKKSTSFLLAALLAVGSSGAFAQAGPQAKTFRQKAFSVSSPEVSRLLNPNSRPGTSQNFASDMAGGWVNYSNSTYTYDAQGRLTERIDRVPDTNQNIYRFTNAFDANGNQTEQFSYDWDGTQWVMTGNSYKTTYTYNTAGKPTEITEQNWNETATAFENSWRSVITYNQVGFISSETYYQPTGNNWTADSRDTYTFTTPGAPPTGLLFESYNGSGFEPAGRIVDIVWHNYDEFEPISYTSEDWNGAAYVPAYRATISYDALGGSIETNEVYANGNWTMESRWTETYDSHHNYTGTKGETWTGASWMVDYEDQEVLTYNANNDITQRVFRNTFNLSGTLEDDRKELYDNFVYVTAAPANAPKLAVTLFPNPTSGYLRLKGQPGTASVTLTDVMGRVLLSQTLDMETGMLNLSRFAAGTYLLHLASPQGTQTTKVVKQ